jgi:crotonobetainyl-CoA:carnitine CoA-transferase CaiB-like acyl-CoA transferase
MDEWCAISVATDEQWKALTKAMAQADWGSDRRFAAVSGRIRHHDEVDRKIEAWTQILPNTEVEFRLKAVGIPAERMRRINDLLESENGATVFVKMAEARVGSMLTTRLPFSLSSDYLPPARSAPSLGEHTTEVLREWLNLSHEEIGALKKQEALI